MLLPFIFLVWPFFVLPGHCEVVSSFDSCPGFFFNEKFPNNGLEPQNPARICQRYQNQYVFATLYDRTNRIPIYSAYVYNPKPGQRSGDWMIEPQLANAQYGADMEDERETTVPVAEIEASQATFNDYKEAPYYVDKGHLNPVVHQSDSVSKDATFTLTNIVPQYNKLNQGPWNEYEITEMVEKKKNFGCSKIYVITGAVPGSTFIGGNRVNYPSHIWSAACCEIDPKKRVSWGVIADNSWNVQPSVVDRTLPQLEQELSNLYNKPVDLFGGSCY